MTSIPLPVAVIGAGPVGLAAAAELLARGECVKVYEAGEVGAHVSAWGHVRLFSPWRYNIAAAARALLAQQGWHEPDPEAFPTGAMLVRDYLRPLAAVPSMAAVIETGARITAISRRGLDKVTSRGRANRAFLLEVQQADGLVRSDLARAVIDTSGTWSSPNPLGAGGLPAVGEAQNASAIAYGLPDVCGAARADYAGKTVLVAGAGHSAANVLIDLAGLRETEPGTRLIWLTRGTDLSRVYGGGVADQLAQRGALGERLASLVARGDIEHLGGFAVTQVARSGDRLVVRDADRAVPRPVQGIDRIVVATGQRPDLAMTRELRLDLDPWLESARALGPLIDPNLHSCGSVPPHGHRELAHPEPGFYTAGIKSYGRAPTFLMMTGYEQVRSIAAALSGDMAAADAVQLALPETGVCATGRAASEATSCCGGPSPLPDACFAADARAKADTEGGCGCPAPSAVAEPA